MQTDEEVVTRYGCEQHPYNEAVPTPSGYGCRVCGKSCNIVPLKSEVSRHDSIERLRERLSKQRRQARLSWQAKQVAPTQEAPRNVPLRAPVGAGRVPGRIGDAIAESPRSFLMSLDGGHR